MPRTTAASTLEQRFFPGFAQIWCENATDASSRVRATTDPHWPGANGVDQNMQEFEHAFSCKAGDPMVSVQCLPGLIVAGSAGVPESYCAWASPFPVAAYWATRVTQ
jgi:hypothetical protein